MPAATIADGVRRTHPSTTGDTPVMNDPAVVAEMIDAYTGRARRRFPSSEMLHSAAAMIPGLHPAENAGRTWGEVTAAPDLFGEGERFEVEQDQALTEGPRWLVSVSPGRVRVWTRDEARFDRRENHERDLRMKAADALSTFYGYDDDGNMIDGTPEDPVPSREVTGWSAKSRVNMIASYADLDYTPMFEDPQRVAAMLTLTYPRCWQTVAPNGKAVKAHMKKWRKRWERQWDEPLRCIWKLEFQGRREFVYSDGEQRDNWCRCEECREHEDGRAPHVHLLVTLPRSRYRRDGRGRLIPEKDAEGRPILGSYQHEQVTMSEFRTWLSSSWADCVAHPDPVEYAAHLAAGTRVDTTEGGRAADPRRVATYFAKHGGAKAKEYQHIVPRRWQEPGQGPGRFWGYWGLEKRVVTVAVDPSTGADAGRVVRRHSRAQGVTSLTMRRRYKGGRADSKYGEVIGLAGKQLLEAHRMTLRPCRTRAVRAKTGRGWLMVNDGAAMGAHLGRALQAAAEHRLERTEQLLNPADPLVRAFRLPDSPRRDALIAKLSKPLTTGLQ